MTLAKNNTSVGVVGHYRSPSQDPGTYINDLNTLLSTNAFHKCDVEVFCGDININLLDSNSTMVNNYINCLKMYGYLQKINKPTRVANNSSTCIDHFFLCGKQESKASIITSGLTDHYKILLSIELKIVKNSYKPRYITKTDHIKLKEYLDGETWQEVCGANSSDQASERLIEVLQGHIKKATKSFKISNK